MNNPYPEWGSPDEPEWAFRACAMIDRLAGQLAELQEAVRWERECEAVYDSRMAPYFSTWEHLSEARAEVDKLIGGK